MAPSEPDPKQWLTPARRSLLKGQLEPIARLLRQSGVWRATLGYWVRWQASLEVDWPADEEKRILDQLQEQWCSKHHGQAELLTTEELRAKLRVAHAVAHWSRQQWGHRIQSLYLQRKSGLDRASCRLLRLDNKYFAIELYHRIKAGETTFERAARDFGQGPEALHGGLLPLQPLDSMPLGLAPLLERLETGRLTMPLRLGNGFCLVQLENWQPAQLNLETEEFLLAEQLRMWVDLVVETMDHILR